MHALEDFSLTIEKPTDITYIIFEFQTLMWKIVPPHLWLAFTVLGWGICATCQAATVNWAGMMALRSFLGIFESGFGPGHPLPVELLLLATRGRSQDCGLPERGALFNNVFRGTGVRHHKWTFKVG